VVTVCLNRVSKPSAAVAARLLLVAQPNPGTSRANKMGRWTHEFSAYRHDEVALVFAILVIHHHHLNEGKPR